MTYPSFSSGEVLRSADMNAVGMWLVSSTSYVNTSTIVVDNCFTSNFRNYLILVSMNCQTQGTGQVDFKLRAGGVNTSASSYVWQGVNQNVSGAPSSNNGNGTSFYASNIFSSSAASTTFEMKLFNPQISASHTAIHNSTFFYWEGPTYYYRNSMGAWLADGSYDGFSLTVSRAINGQIRIYGLKD